MPDIFKTAKLNRKRVNETQFLKNELQVYFYQFGVCINRECKKIKQVQQIIQDVARL